MEFLQFTDRRISMAEVLASIRPPVARPDTATTNEDSRVTFNLLSNDSDPDGDALSVLTVNPTGLKGSVGLGANGAVTYTPGAEHQALGAGETAVETFTYLVQDAGLNTATGTATVTVTGVNDAPRAAADSFTMGEDEGALDVTARLLANDRDPDRTDTLTISAVGNSSSGAAVTLSADGKVTYDPGALFQWLGAGETATDTFHYTVRDTFGAQSHATATVTIQGAADREGPVLQLMIMEDEVSENLLDHLIEALGVIRVTGVSTQGTLGDVVLSGDGDELRFSAENLDMLLADSTTVTRFGWTGVTAAGVVKSGSFEVRVGGEYDPVTAVPDSVAATEGQSTGNLWTTLLSNDIDPETTVQSRWIVGVDTTGTAGTVQYDKEARSLVYVAPELAPGETLTDTFRYTAHDSFSPSGSETSAVVTVTVTGGPNGAATVTVEAGPVGGDFEGFDFSMAVVDEETTPLAGEDASLVLSEPLLDAGASFTHHEATFPGLGSDVADGLVI
jgi:VCBS repeat-containing protein